jgi:hypothetical protein
MSLFSLRLFDGISRGRTAISLTQRSSPVHGRDGVEGGGQERSIGVGPTE